METAAFALIMNFLIVGGLSTVAFTGVLGGDEGDDDDEDDVVDTTPEPEAPSGFDTAPLIEFLLTDLDPGEAREPVDQNFEPDLLRPNQYAETITGDEEAQSIDRSRSGQGAAIETGDGDDSVLAGGAADFVDSGAGNDDVELGRGDDIAFGREGDDTIEGDFGGDIVFGGDGNDVLSGGDGDDAVFGGKGADTLFGGAESDVVFGGSGADQIFGGEDITFGRNPDAADTLSGGDGQDTINASGGDLAEGGAGSDRFVISEDAGQNGGVRIADYTDDGDRIEIRLVERTDPGSGDPVEAEVSVNETTEAGVFEIVVDGERFGTVEGDRAVDVADLILTVVEPPTDGDTA